MPNGDSNNEAVYLVAGAALIGGAVWYLVSHQNGNGEPPPPPPPPTGRLILTDPAALRVSADGDVIGPGQEMQLNGIDYFLVVEVRSRWQNPTTQALWLNRRIEVAHRQTAQPDDTWVVFEPGRGIVQDFPGQGTAHASFAGDTGALLLPALTVTELDHILIIAGPHWPFPAPSFWASYENPLPGVSDICFNVLIQYFQMPQYQSIRQEGTLLGQGSWGFGSGTPGFCLDIAVILP